MRKIGHIRFYFLINNLKKIEGRRWPTLVMEQEVLLVWLTFKTTKPILSSQPIFSQGGGS